MISEAIKLINDGLVISDTQKSYGIAQTILRPNEDQNTFDSFPGIINESGEITYVGIDDVESIIIYHKINSAASSLVKTNSYGDSTNTSSILNCFLLGFYDTRKIPMQSVDVMMILQAKMPQEIKEINEGIKQVIVTNTGAVLNSNQVYNSEYKYANKSMPLPEFIVFFQLNYTIQFIINPQCMRQCICI